MLRQPQRAAARAPTAAGSGRRRRPPSRRARAARSAARAACGVVGDTCRRAAGCAAARPRRPCASANALTGDGLQLHAAAGRPVGLGQHQRRSSKPAACSARQRDARELGRAGERDPHRRGRSGALLVARLLQHLGLDAVALERAQVLDEHLAEQVVHLVLDADRQQALGLELAAARRRGPSARTRDARVALRPCRRSPAPTGSLRRRASSRRCVAISSGLISTSGSSRASEVSITITRSCTSTCVAARPTPSAAYMVSSMSSTSWRMRASTSRHRLGHGVQARIGVAQDVELGHW